MRHATRPARDRCIVECIHLMTCYAAGDLSVFGELYKCYSGPVLRYLHGLARDRERAKDLLQITMERLHRARHTYAPGAPVLPWLLTIARHAFYDERRTRRARPEVLTQRGVFSSATTSSADAELRYDLCQALAGLPRTHREALLLTRWGGRSPEEAATELGISRSAVKARAHRGSRGLGAALR